VQSGAEYGGSACPHLSESQECNTACCPVACIVEDWGLFGACTQSCGGGTQSRSRATVSAAICGGAACPPLSQSSSCNAHACPVDCVVSGMRRVLGIILRGGQGETLVPPTAVAGGDEGFVFEFEASDNNNSG
jgi:hypothetical protein